MWWVNGDDRQFPRDRRGSAALMFGLLGPVVALGAAAAVEYGSLLARRTQLQKAADGAAIAATQQLRLSNNSDTVILGVARSVATASVSPKDDAGLNVDGRVGDKRTSVTVTVREAVRGAFGRLLSLPMMELEVTAKARLSGTTRLCLLALDRTNGKVLNLDTNSTITAPGCGVYSNSGDKEGLNVEQNARLSASQICSSGGVAQKSGSLLTPVPSTDCPQVADPLAALPRPTIGLCSGLNLGLKIKTTRTLMPGTYCGGIEISGNADVTLYPGVYIMLDGPLIVSGSAKLSGRNVGVYFSGSRGGLRLDPDTSISLTAPKSGEMAGLLFFEDRSLAALLPLPPGPKGLLPPPPQGSLPMRPYQISSNNAPTLLGTIYLPAGRLTIDATRPVADRSAYTVIVARQLDLNSGPNLHLNSDYEGSDIPVPQGVGPNSGHVSLTQ